jgi:hypothetical protein
MVNRRPGRPAFSSPSLGPISHTPSGRSTPPLPTPRPLNLDPIQRILKRTVIDIEIDHGRRISHDVGGRLLLVNMSKSIDAACADA